MGERMTAEEWCDKGYKLLELEKYEEALEAFEKAIKLNPGYAPGWHGKGCVLDSLGRFEESLISYDTAIEINEQPAISWYNKGLVLDKMGRYGEAREAIDIAGRIDWEVVPDWSKPDELPQCLKESHVNDKVEKSGADIKKSIWHRLLKLFRLG